MPFSQTLPFIDSVAHYNSSGVLGKWVFGGPIGPPSPTPGAGRTGLNGAIIANAGANAAYTTGGQVASFSIGAAYKSEQVESPQPFQLFGTGAVCPSIYIQPSSASGAWQLVVAQQNNSTFASVTFGSGGRFIIPGVWYYFELTGTVSPSSASGSIYVNGKLEASANITANFTLNNNSYAYFDHAVLRGKDGFGGVSYFCDIYVAAGGTFGDMLVTYITANNVGNSSQWLPTPSVPNWQNVDNIPANTSVYNQGSNVGDEDTYAMQPIYNNYNTISIVQGIDYLTTDSGSANVNMAYRNAGGNEVLGLLVAASGGGNYTYAHESTVTSPFTGNNWNISEFTGIQFGQKRSA